MSELRFEDQLLAFKVRLTQCGPMAALKLLNDRTRYRSTALYRISHEDLHLLQVFDRFDQNRAYWQSALLLDALGRITLEDGGFVTSDCRRDDRLKPLGGLIMSYCGLVLAPLGGAACGLLCHFDTDRPEMKPCELAFLRAVAPLLLDHVI